MPSLDRIRIQLSIICSPLFLLNSCSGLMSKPIEEPNPNLKPTAALALPEDAGTIWFPLRWHMTIPPTSEDKQKEPLTSLTFSSAGLILRARETGTEHLIPFVAEAPNGPEVAPKETVLSGADRLKTVRLPRFFSLPQGVYTVEGVGGLIPDGSAAKARRTTVPFKNLFQQDSSIKLEIEVKKGKLGILPQMQISTKFFRQAQALVHQSEFEAIEKNHLAGESVFPQFGGDNRIGQRMYAASTDFTKLRIPLSSSPQNATEDVFARVAIAVEAPCTTPGRYNFIWKRSGDAKEYVSSAFLKDDGAACSTSRKAFSIAAFPYGKWSLIATSFSEGAEDAKEKDNLLNVFFDFSNGRKMDSAEQYDPKSANSAKTVLYAGAVRLSLSGDNKVKDKTKNIDSIWERRFVLDSIKDASNATKVYNAYRLLPITKDQTKETIRTVIRTQATNTDLIKKFRTELQNRAREVFAACIQERHQIDPLLIVAGVLRFSAAKWVSYADFSDLEIEGDKSSTLWFEECLERRFRRFRFSERIPEAFQGSLSFQLE